MEKASEQEHEGLRDLAERLGFTDVRLIHRDGRTSPLIHARWRGAPVALSLRTGIAGGFSCAFYRGPQTPQLDEDGEEWTESEWDEVADSRFGFPEMALVMGAALLAEYSDGRELAYQGITLRETPRPEPTDDEVLDAAMESAREVSIHKEHEEL